MRAQLGTPLRLWCHRVDTRHFHKPVVPVAALHSLPRPEGPGLAALLSQAAPNTEGGVVCPPPTTPSPPKPCPLPAFPPQPLVLCPPSPHHHPHCCTPPALAAPNPDCMKGPSSCRSGEDPPQVPWSRERWARNDNTWPDNEGCDGSGGICCPPQPQARLSPTCQPSPPNFMPLLSLFHSPSPPFSTNPPRSPFSTDKPSPAPDPPFPRGSPCQHVSRVSPSPAVPMTSCVGIATPVPGGYNEPAHRDPPSPPRRCSRDAGTCLPYSGASHQRGQLVAGAGPP